MLYEHLPKTTARLLSWLLAVAVVVVIGISLTYSLLATPYADDFCRATLGTNSGDWLRHVAETYRVWSGRWAVHALYGLSFPYIGITSHAYNFCILFSPVLWFLTFYMLLWILFGHGINPFHRTVSSIVLCAVYWVGMPQVGETWYWLTGLIEYTLPTFLLVVTILILTSHWASGASILKRMLSGFFAASTAILVTGLNELTGLLLAGIIALAIIIQTLQNNHRLRVLHIIVFVVTLAGVAINIFAPGTAGHAAAYTQAYSLKAALGIVLFRPDVSPLTWLVDPRLICLSLILLTSPWFLSIRPKWSDWKLPYLSQAAGIPIVLAVAVFGVFVLISYAQGIAPFARVLNILYAIFIAGWLLWLVAIGRLVAGSLESKNALLRGINIGAGLLLPLSLIIAPTTASGIRDLKYVMANWHRAVVDRDQVVRLAVASGATDITLEPIDERPSLFFWGDLENNDKGDGYWRNECVAKFYRARRIIVGRHPD